MSSTDPFPSAPADPGNAPAFSVTELAFALKRTLEDAFGHVRLRGEISKVTRHASGHIYLTLKDDKAAIDGVIWKGSVRGLKAQPEQGLEVIVTGRITTYPARSGYQIIIESLEPAGVGALLAQLERLKARLTTEGLFDAARKPALPQMPTVIGVITSPTGAVIRDILHRIADRWPARVIVWPVVVQGDSAAAQVARAIAGFNGLPPDGPVPRPDVLIVARGGAAAASTIPLISAVGHETDTTLIDYAAARRAPTPTAAAEMATPVLADLRASLSVAGGRLDRAAAHGLEGHRTRLGAASAALPRLADLVELAGQRFDFAASRLAAALAANVAVQAQRLTGVAARLTPPLLSRPVDLAGQRLGELGGRLGAAMARQQATTAQRADLPGLGLRMQQAVHRRLTREAAGLERLEQLRRSVDPNRPLSLGFARVHRIDGTLVTAASALSAGDGLRLVFADGDRDVTVNGAAPSRKPPPAAAPAPSSAPQGSLFD